MVVTAGLSDVRAGLLVLLQQIVLHCNYIKTLNMKGFIFI